MMVEISEETVRELGAALKAAANKARLEEVVNTGLALVLIKKGILDAVGIEIMRSAALGAYTDADETFLAAINERVDGLHNLLVTGNAPSKYDG